MTRELSDTVPPGPVIVYEVTESHDMVNCSKGLGHKDEGTVGEPVRLHPSPTTPWIEPEIELILGTSIKRERGKTVLSNFESFICTYNLAQVSVFSTLSRSTTSILTTHSNINGRSVVI